jgi:hypothetical protein
VLKQLEGGRAALLFGCVGLIAAAALAACGQATTTAQPPVDSVTDWFAAINSDNVPAVQAHFADANWAEAWKDPAPPDLFQDLRCTAQTQTETTAIIDCTFHVREGWGGMEAGDSWWSVELKRQPPGPWLITNYGQG